MPGSPSKHRSHHAEGHTRPRHPRPDCEATERWLHHLLLHKQGDDTESPALPKLRPAGAFGGSLGANGARQLQLQVSLMDPPAALSAIDLEADRQAFVEEICTSTTRPDVQDWVEKIFNMKYNLHLQERGRDTRRGRRWRLRSSSIASDSGLSGQTGLTGVTGTTGTALRTAGSIASRGRRPAGRPVSVNSDESLVVHPQREDKPLSVPERVQAYLECRLPELQRHVDAAVVARTEALRREVDEELSQEFLRRVDQRRVFDGRANFVRWQNRRQKVLQARLEAEMSAWVLEAIESWDQAKAAQKKDKEVSETDLIFEYLTKRAAHIDSGKLPTEIPIFPALKTSASLPRMWRDKYL